MKIRPKGASGVVAGTIGIAMLASACSADPGGSEVAAGPGESVGIAEENRVGAMENFGVGDTFRATEAISIDMLYRQHPEFPAEDGWRLWSALEENQNVTLERVDVPLADFDSRRNLLISAGDFPALVTHVHQGHETAWVPGGALLPISEYLDYMPHFTHFAEEWDLTDQLDAMRQDDGKFYRLPGLLEVPDAGWMMIVNQDLFDAAGITEDPVTTEQFLDTFEKIVERTDADFGYGARHGDLNASLTGIASNFLASAGWGLSATWYDAPSGQFVANALTDGYQELVEFYHEMFARGILDPEISDGDLTVEKFTTGRVAAMTSDFGGLSDAVAQAREAGLPHNFRMMVSPDGPTGGHVMDQRLAWGFALNANLADSPYFLATLQFIDWLLYSEEGREFALFGLEGETFTIDEDGNRVLNADLWHGMMNAGAPNNLTRTHGFGDSTFTLGHGGSAELIEAMLPQDLRDFRAAHFARREPLPVVPRTPLTELELERIATTQTQVNDHVRANTLKFILGQRPMSEWDAFTAEVESQGVQSIVDIQNEALARN